MPLFPIDDVGVWDEFVRWARGLPENQSQRWIFRGELAKRGEPARRGEEEGILSSFDRTCGVWGVHSQDRPRAEQRLLRDFRRHPEANTLRLHPKDYLGWFALMQHHGAPTRLLDWTYSPFVAAFFAVEKLYDNQQWAPVASTPVVAGACVVRETSGNANSRVPVVWALNTDGLNRALRNVLDEAALCLLDDKKKRTSFRRLFVERSPATPFVSTATPLRLNERMSVQQGLFLCPGDVSRTWQDNLQEVVSKDDDASWRRAFAIDPTDMESAFTELRRINISRRSLFPGLDGYAKSMAHRLKFLLELPVSGV